MTFPHDRRVAAWLAEGAHQGSPESLTRALEATRQARKRPRWTFPERWLPIQRTPAQASPMRPLMTVATLALLLAALITAALFVSSRPPTPPHYRNGAIVFERGGWLYIADQLDGAPRPLIPSRGSDFSPVFSPQGDRVAFIRGEAGRSVMTVRTDGTNVRNLAQLPPGYGQLDWSPDGRAILASHNAAYTDAFDVFLIESDGSGARPIETGVEGRFGLAAWRPEGRNIALAVKAGQGSVAVITDADGADAEVIWSSASPGARLAWSPDGARLALSHGSTVTVVDVDAGGDVTASHEFALDLIASGISGPSWSADGRHLAVMLESGRVAIMTADGADYRTVGPTFEPDTHRAGFTWSPDGRTIVVTGTVFREDPATGTSSWTDTPWSIDVTTGEESELATPVHTWQRLAP